MKQPRTISEVDRRLLQSGKHWFSCDTGNETVQNRIVASVFALMIGGMIGATVWLGSFIR